MLLFCYCRLLLLVLVYTVKNCCCKRCWHVECCCQLFSKTIAPVGPSGRASGCRAITSGRARANKMVKCVGLGRAWAGRHASGFFWPGPKPSPAREMPRYTRNATGRVLLYTRQMSSDTRTILGGYESSHARATYGRQKRFGLGLG
jgi:hypothetical protein